MDKDAIIEAIRKFFGDTSRSAQETKDGLMDIAAECEMLAESIPDETDDSMGLRPHTLENT